MTTFNKSTLKALWINGFVPQGTDYSNFIDSQVNIAETAEQDMAGALSTTELITPRVSAASLNVTATISAFGLLVNGGNCVINANQYAVTSNTMNLNAGSGININSKISYPVAIVSAAGTTQATAALISTSANIIRLQGASDGQATGYILPSAVLNNGVQQTVINENAVSANLWPNLNCKINALANNAVFGMAANTTYIVVYSQNSAYAVK